MDIHGVKGDLYQASVVTKYEFLKYTRNKRLYLSLAINLLLLLLFTALGMLMDGGLPKDSKELMSLYANGAMFVVIISATLLSSGTLVSEFEDRTALIMFTRPVRKTTIFLGKLVANFLTCAALVTLYYVFSIVICLVWTGGLPSGILTSIGFALLFTLAATGVGMFFSSMVKRSLIATLLTLVLFLIMWMAIDSMLAVIGIEPVFSITYAATAIISAISGAKTTLLTEADGLPPGFTMYSYYPEPAMAVLVLLVWFIITTLIAWMVFRKREF